MRALVSMLWNEERGYSLVELLVVMVILSMVLAGLTTVFVGGSTAEVRLNQRFQAQQQARLALDRVRSDIHCASHAQVSPINSLPALRLNVTNCSTSTRYAYWCVSTVSTSPPRYKLWRTTSAVAPTSATCTSTDASRTQVADYLVSSAVFTTNGIPHLGLQTVGVDFRVSVSPTATKNVYELTDGIVARNYTPRCATTTCAVTSVP
jgi:prepilin-type N-terminal cleavage/methylation domain-containing protein